jgi:hypothetical protein
MFLTRRLHLSSSRKGTLSRISSRLSPGSTSASAGELTEGLSVAGLLTAATNR